MSWQEHLQDYVDFLKSKYGLTDAQIRDELLSEKVPTDAFSTDLTPLQAVAKYLEQLGNDPKRIAGAIGRTTSEVEKFLKGAAGHPRLPGTGPKIAASVFRDRTLSASEHLVEQLEQRGYSVAEIARMLAKSERTIWTLHYRVQEKRGESR